MDSSYRTRFVEEGIASPNIHSPTHSMKIPRIINIKSLIASYDPSVLSSANERVLVRRYNVSVGIIFGHLSASGPINRTIRSITTIT